MSLDKIGGPIAGEELYTNRVDQVTGKIVGFHYVEGSFQGAVVFEDGEEGLVKLDSDNTGNRKTFVKLKDGTLKPVDLYIKEKKG